jgi:hypothetical protein
MVRRRFALASHTHGRTADGGKRRGGAGRGNGGSVAQGGRCPGCAGPEWAEAGLGARPATNNPRKNGKRVPDAVWAEK